MNGQAKHLGVKLHISSEPSNAVRQVCHRSCLQRSSQPRPADFIAAPTALGQAASPCNLNS